MNMQQLTSVCDGDHKDGLLHAARAQVLVEEGLQDLGVQLRAQRCPGKRTIYQASAAQSDSTTSCKYLRHS